MINSPERSALSKEDANAAIELINLIGQIKVERQLEILWGNILNHTQAKSLAIGVYDSLNKSEYARVSDTSKFSKNIDQRYFDYYENSKAWECDPVMYYCLRNLGVNTTEQCWENPWVPDSELHRLEEFREMQKQHVPSGLVAVGRSQLMKGVNVYVGFGLELGGSDEAIIRTIIPHILKSMLRPGLLSCPDFTDKEFQVIEHMMNGFTHKEIADKIFVSERTIKFHLGKIFAKLEVSNKVEAIERCGKLFLFK